MFKSSRFKSSRLVNTMNLEKRMNNCETEEHYICHSERAVATEESIFSVIPAKAKIAGKHVRILFPGGSNGAKSLHAPLPVNSLLGTFTSGQTNAGGVRHVPYLYSVTDVNIVFISTSHVTRHTLHANPHERLSSYL